jgi:hypothetical protein
MWSVSFIFLFLRFSQILWDISSIYIRFICFEHRAFRLLLNISTTYLIYRNNLCINSSFFDLYANLALQDFIPDSQLSLPSICVHLDNFIFWDLWCFNFCVVIIYIIIQPISFCLVLSFLRLPTHLISPSVFPWYI